MTPPYEPDDAPRPSLIRAYTITAGRTQATVEIPLEATLRLMPGREGRGLTPTAAKILQLCDRHSVAEVSALSNMPIGVVRVLLADLIDQGVIRIQATITEQTSTDDRLALIERTLRGLRNY